MGLITRHGVKEWYPLLAKPPGTPPDILFPIVWTILYIFMAIALALLWSSNTQNKKAAYLFFGLQLFLNFIWSWLFFYMQTPALALIDIILLWLLIAFTIKLIWRHTELGSYLLIPYFIWVTYAVYLNLFIWAYLQFDSPSAER